VLRGLGAGLDAVPPRTADEGARGVEAGFLLPGADQRLHHVAEDIVALIGTVVARLFAEAQMRAHAQLARDVGAHRAGDQRVEPLRQLSLGLLGEELPQPFRHDEAEDAVAEEFEPLVILRRLAAVGERALIGRDVGGAAAEGLGQPFGQRDAQKPSPIRCQRAAVNQLTGLIHEALPSVEKKVTTALPSIRSIGM